VGVYKVYLIVPDYGVAVPQVGAAEPQGLYLVPLERYAGLEGLFYMVVEIGLLVLADYLGSQIHTTLSTCGL
jgi:hypothetical protein